MISYMHVISKNHNCVIAEVEMIWLSNPQRWANCQGDRERYRGNEEDGCLEEESCSGLTLHRRGILSPAFCMIKIYDIICMKI